MSTRSGGTIEPHCSFQILDCVGLVVSEVTSGETGEGLAHQVKQMQGEITSCLDITLPSTCSQK